MNYRPLFAILVIGLFSISAFGQVYINEWMASNSSVITDPDFDDSGDWIELYNDQSDPVDLSGLYLSDNFGEPTKWAFPEGTVIEGNSFLLIWADGQNQGMHTSFRLTKDGEEIGLYDSDTVLIDDVKFKHQKTNISMGRSTDGSSDIGFFEEPTPGTSNSSKAYSAITFYQPQYSVNGGLHTNPISLELETIDGDIRYTTDGSQPTLDSELYTDPISISKTTVIRAAVFLEDQLPGKPITHTYFFEPTFAERELPVISISSDPKYFWDDSIGLYVQDFKPSWEYPINIELFENDGSHRAAFNELAGTRVNGLNSWVLPQKMLGIYFDNDYDKNNLEYQLFFDNDRKRFDNFVLRASGSDWGNTLFRDALCQGLTSENMDIEKMAFRPSIVYINGEYMGIHNMRSRIDEGFIEENFGLISTEYDLIENNAKVEEGDDVAFKELFQFVNDNDFTNQGNFDHIASTMDIENFTDYFITEIWSSNSSWGHNIQMWKPKSGGKWRWILQDLDRGFTGISDGLIDNFTTATSPSNYNWARGPLRKLLENEDFSYQFAQRFTDHLYTTFHTERVISIIEKHRDLIDQEIAYHSDRWAGFTSSYGSGLPSVSYWENEVSELVDFAIARPQYLLDDIQTRFELQDLVDLTTMNFPKESGQIFINKLPIPSSPWQGKYFENMAFELEAKPEIGQEFIGWSSAIYESFIDKGSEWKYLDDGSDQGSQWRELNFDDSSWKSGNAKFGYGDENENTTISYGGSPSNKHITTYFRKDIIIEDVNAYSGALSIELLRDDGAIIYLNGKEVVRSNLPEGEINSETLASSYAAGQEESTYYSFLINQSNLVEGKNVIAAEIHQSEPNSSDLGFDLTLKALRISNNDIFSTQNSIIVNLHSDSILVANYQESDLCTLPSRISANTVLDISCSPYYAVSNVVVDSSVTLTIEEGVQVFFPEDKNLEIRGNLMIEGSEDSPVLITAVDENRPWGGIIFKYASDHSILNHLEISKASNGNHPIYENAAVSAYYSSIELNHMTIEDVESNPILSYYSDVILRNSSLHSKVTGDLINVKYGRGEVSNSIFRGNNQIDTDAIDFDGVLDGKIIGNKIFDFFGFNSDGIDIGEETPEVIIEGNFIHNCSDKGISVGQKSFISALHNVIVNCDRGIAVKDLSGANVEQNTFYSVGIPVSCFEKNVGLGGGSSLIRNTIFSNSSYSSIDYDDVSQIIVTRSLSDTDTLPSTINSFGNPLFENPSFNDFTLMQGSPAIGSGIDADGNSVDLGAEENPYSAEASLMISAIQYFPQGDPDAEFIILYNPKDTPVDLEGYILSDAIDFIFPSCIIEANESVLIGLQSSISNPDISKKFQWTRGRLSNEGENINLSMPSGIVIDHVRYDNNAPWPLLAEGKGSYLELIDPSLDNHFASSWISQLNTSTIQQIVEDRVIITYPNPAKNLVTVEHKKGLINKLEIINVFGQTVYSSIENTCCVLVNIQDLVAGTYFIRVNGLMEQSPLVIGN